MSGNTIRSEHLNEFRRKLICPSSRQRLSHCSRTLVLTLVYCIEKDPAVVWRGRITLYDGDFR
jgi:hypothetical protein